MNDTVQPSMPDPMTSITEAIADLGVYLAMWDNRGEPPTAAARAAAGEAVGRIDGALNRLHRLRERLVTEIRQADDATAARADALLEQYREERGATLHDSNADGFWGDTGSGPGYAPDDSTDDTEHGDQWGRHDDPEENR